ncbi:hypothetical protein [Rouxiella silvae]
MATFLDESYKIEFYKLDNYFERALGKLAEDYPELESCDDEHFIDRVTYSAWKIFSGAYTHRLELLDKYTSFNRKSLGDRARPTLDGYVNNKENFLNILLRNIYEYHFWLNDAGEYPEILRSWVFNRIEKVLHGRNESGRFYWIERSMSASLFRDLLKEQGFDKLKSLQDDILNYQKNIPKFIEESKDGVEKELDKSVQQVQELIERVESSKEGLQQYENKLNEYKRDYNFVLLSKAFKKLLDKKTKELYFARGLTWIFTLVLIFMPITSLLNHKYKWLDVGVDMASLIYYVPVVTLEVVIFYFMRLYYGEVRMIKTQLLQIDHRLSLCEFIHDYVEKRKDSPEEKDSWKAFENLIFSPIQLSADNIPSVLDGANAIADLAGKVIPKKG